MSLDVAVDSRWLLDLIAPDACYLTHRDITHPQSACNGD